MCKSGRQNKNSRKTHKKISLYNIIEAKMSLAINKISIQREYNSVLEKSKIKLFFKTWLKNEKTYTCKSGYLYVLLFICYYMSYAITDIILYMA